ncbi:MAG: phosphoribosylformylglycinamidine synthase subunit PurQ [Actinomycetota bacterium]
MKPRVAVVTFPGSNDDRDALRAVALMGGEPVSAWHGDGDLQGTDAVILPGGFSYGDYLRTGAIARFAPVMLAVREYAEEGRPVLGICNGFQILCEAGLLPGALIRNRGLSFVCRKIQVRTEDASGRSPGFPEGEVLQVPIKHGEGQFVASQDELSRIEEQGLVAMRYCAADGAIDERYNPNGSANNIAGLRNDRGNVVGMMPHPEHAVDPDLGPTGGHAVLQWLLAAARERVNA